jgi:hypothetical protein
MRDELARLKARARKLGMTIQRGRGTGSGWYTVHRPNVVRETCDGLAELAEQLTRIENELGSFDSMPTDADLARAVKAASDKHYDERFEHFLASKAPECRYCGQPSDGSDESRVGPEDVYWWVHRRCYDAFIKRNQERRREMGLYDEHGFRIVR